MASIMRPHTLEDAVAELDKQRCLVFAGGTDLLVRHRRPRGLIPAFDCPVLFIDGIEALKTILCEGEMLYIGAGVTLAELIAHPEVPEILKCSARDIAAPALRNRATLGGNICNASPAADTLPALYVLDAKIELRSSKDVSVMALDEFIQGPGKIARTQEQLLTCIMIPRQQPDHFVWRKIGTRRANALSKLSVAALGSAQGNGLREFRIAFGAVGPTVVRSQAIEQSIVSSSLDKETLEQVVESYRLLLSPIDDQRSTANYRHKVALNLLVYSLTQLQAGK